MPNVPRVFIGYSSQPAQVGTTIETAAGAMRSSGREISTWRQLDIPGHFIIDKVLEGIDSADLVVMDITKLNFNVTFETGYALAKQKRVVLTMNRSLNNDQKAIDALGIFDTIGYEPYENSDELANAISTRNASQGIRLPSLEVDRSAPLFLLDTLHKTDSSARTKSLIKKTRIRHRSFDPAEQSRLSALEAFRNVSSSLGIVIHLIGANARDQMNNNLRGAFLAGIAWALNKPLLLLQEGDDPVPLDYREFVSLYNRPTDIDAHIAELALQVTAGLQAVHDPAFRPSVGLLASVSLGAVAAENEISTLSDYYVDTDQHRRAIGGTVRLAVGRKGSGKTALFFQVRDALRKKSRLVVLDLKPDGYQLKRFKELLEVLLGESNREHAATAFWEYLLLVEIAHKILDKDKVRHTRDHRLYEKYRNLLDASDVNPYVKEGDFSLRMLALAERIYDDYSRASAAGANQLDSGFVTELIYKADITAIRDALIPYLDHLDALWILVDNLDKGWPTHGVDGLDILILRSLIAANRKIERIFRSKQDFETHSLIFLRNDVYELLVDQTPDRGKEARVSLDWTDRDLLLELLRRRLVNNPGMVKEETFEQTWRRICISHVGTEDSANWILDRCLMRPRYLLSLVEHCKANAVNLNHATVELQDLDKAARTYSADIANEIGFEIRDVMPEAEDVMYGFIGAKPRLSYAEVRQHLAAARIADDIHERVTELLLWFGFLGVARAQEETIFIYDVLYDMKKLKALRDRMDGPVYAIHKAFCPFLDIDCDA
jgi:hypothetical protein